MPICSQCGTDNHANNVTCVYCHEPLNQKKQTFESFSNTQRSSSQSDLSGIVLLLLFIFLPTAHYMYVNKIGLAILFFITGGGFGLWWLIDLIRIVSGNFPDQNGKPIRL
jgi:hypothetical protein